MLTNTTTDDDDYDVIIEESGVGDPTIFASFSFQGAKVPTQDDPLTDVEIKVAVLWPQINHRIDVGSVHIGVFHHNGPYRFGLPYDDRTFTYQVNENIPCDILFTIKAKKKGGILSAKFKGVPTGDGYLYVVKDVIPKIYKD